MDAGDACVIGEAHADDVDRTTPMPDQVADGGPAEAGSALALPQAIYDRVTPLADTFRAFGPAALRSTAHGIGQALDPRSDRLGLGATRSGKAVLSAVNGVLGDTLARRGNSLALRMAFRWRGIDVLPTSESLAGLLPDATPRVVVFVHGFGESDDSWGWYSEAHWAEEDISYGELLRRELGFTPLYLNYNSGRALEVGAAELSGLVGQLVANWPVPIEQLVLVGHSGGGAVARAAIQHGARIEAPWVASVSHLFRLGAPRNLQVAERAVQGVVSKLGLLLESGPTTPLSELLDTDLSDENLDVAEPLPAGVAEVAVSGEELRVSHFKLLNHPLVYREIKQRVSDRSVPDQERAARGGRYARAATALRSRRRSQRRSR